jgi:hypothetical protein
MFLAGAEHGGDVQNQTLTLVSGAVTGEITTCGSKTSCKCRMTRLFCVDPWPRSVSLRLRTRSALKIRKLTHHRHRGQAQLW